MGLRPGDIILWDGNSLISKAIKKITGSQWSHAAWVWDEHFVIESDWNGVIVSPITNYLSHPKQYAILRIPSFTGDRVTQVMDKVVSKFGKQYDYKLFFGLFWDWVMGRERSKRTAGTRSAYICSELIAGPLYSTFGFTFHEGIAVSNITPEDIWTSPWVTVVEYPKGRKDWLESL
jgi:uncharacterized protein YycO